MDPYCQNKSVRTPELLALKQANIKWSECVTANFLPKWLEGESISLNEVCQEEYSQMIELDGANKPPLPFKLASTQ